MQEHPDVFLYPLAAGSTMVRFPGDTVRIYEQKRSETLRVTVPGMLQVVRRDWAPWLLRMRGRDACW